MGDDIEHSDFVQKLIDAVRERRCLYDKKHIAYFNRREREKAWQHIGQQLGRSDTDCHKRWKLLREKLAKELKKRDRAVDNGEQFQSDWACFRNIMFVEDHIAPRRKSDRLTCVLPTSLMKKRLNAVGHSEAYDLTKKSNYSASDMNFLVQLSRASELGSAYESDTASEVKAEPEDRPINEENVAEIEEDEEEDVSLNSPTHRPQTPEMLDLTKAVDSLLQDLRDKKAIGIDFLKNLTTVLNVNDPDGQYPKLEDHSNSAEADNVSELDANLFHFIRKGTAKSMFYNKIETSPSPHSVCEANNFSKSFLNRNINEDTKNVNMNSFKNFELQKETAKCQSSLDQAHFNGDKDLLFGRLVISMLADITDENYKDDAKCTIMQLLVNAKRKCNTNRRYSPESTSRESKEF